MKKLVVSLCLLLVIISLGCDNKQTSSRHTNTDTQSQYTNREQGTKEETPKEITVYITRTGQKYHRLGCRSLSKSCIPIELNEAKKKGYTPCLVCNPPSQSYTPIDTPKYASDYSHPVAENGSYYGEISKNTGRPKDVYVDGYYRKDGTYVRGHYRSSPSRRK